MYRRRTRLLTLLLACFTLIFATGLWGETGVQAKKPTGYTNPFLYCADVGTVDAPDGRWAGPKVPVAVAEGLIEAAGLPPEAPLVPLLRMTFWRCMDGQVYACFVGANLPCQAKANTSRSPSPAMWTYCMENPDTDVIPAYVTGRETVYAWRCLKGQPTVVRQVTEPDGRGFLKNIWYKIVPDPR